MIPEIDQQQENLVRLCLRYRVRRLRLFGSAATGGFMPATSDLDYIAEFADTQAADYADRYLDFAEALEKLFNRRMDVLTKRAIQNKYFRSEVERTARVIYEDANQETVDKCIQRLPGD
jgi:predicted nucleotidyltransferase